jgi:hypothetical protein
MGQTRTRPMNRRVRAWVSFFTRGYPKFQILMVLTQSAHLNFNQPRSFRLAQYYPPLKSHTITLGGVDLTHQLCSSLGSSIHRALVIEFTSTLLKPAGDPKPTRNPVGVAAGVVAGAFRRVPRVWLWADFCQTHPKPAPLPSLPMTKPKQTWQKKWLAKEEGYSSSDSNGEEVSKVTPARGEDNVKLCDGKPESGNCNPESGKCHPKSGNRNPDSSNSNLGKENDRQGEVPVPMDLNMVSMTSAEFCAPMEDVAELVLGAAVFKKPENSGVHMKPLFIRGHLDGMLIGHMLVDGGASINILPLSLFKKLNHVEGDLKRTNLSLSSLAGDPMEAKGITCKEVTVGRKTVPTAFFVVDVKEHYNVLLRRDWIHANECVPSTLHQCVIQWIGDEVEVVQVTRRCASPWPNLKSTS